MKKIYRFSANQWLPRQPEEVFSFFSDAKNLEALTPPWVKFKILTPLPIDIKEGTLIDYKLKVHGLPIHWRTEITEWNPPHHFVDTQLMGPYTLLHHTHSFSSKDGGTLCSDLVRYRPRGGALINQLFVRRDVDKIFKYRKSQLQKLLSMFELRKLCHCFR